MIYTIKELGSLEVLRSSTSDCATQPLPPEYSLVLPQHDVIFHQSYQTFTDLHPASSTWPVNTLSLRGRRVPQSQQQHSGVLQLMSYLLNLLRGAWRLVVLLTMFAPVMATGHLAMTHGYHRADWLSWLRRASQYSLSDITESSILP